MLCLQGDPEAAQIILNHAMLGTDAVTVNKAKDWSAVPDSELRVPVVFVMLDVTHKVLVSNDVLATIQRKHLLADKTSAAATAAAAAAATTTPLPSTSPLLSKYGQLITSLFLFFADSYKKTFKFDHGPPLHDPVAVFYALNPAAFSAPAFPVAVECARSLSRGQTVVDVWGQTSKEANALVCESVDLGLFWEAMGDAIGRVGETAQMDK